MLGDDIVETIRALIRKYPFKRNIIVALFGDPDQDGFLLPVKISVNEAARKSGMPYPTVQAFFQKVIRPFFATRFAYPVRRIA